jgi:hypothetical protein
LTAATASASAAASSSSSSSSGAAAAADVPQQRTKAAAYVSPPKPILPIANQPSSPPKKRDVEQIEGIEEREENPKAKAKAKPRIDASVEEIAKLDTIINDFLKNEI